MKEVQTIMELCQQLVALSAVDRREATLKGLKDLMEIKSMIDGSKNDDETVLIAMEAVVAMVNVGLRKQVLRGRIVEKLSEEKDISLILQQHREDFAQLIWKRRTAMRRESRNLF
ncbi:hypothetical protein BJ742DRAFT_707848, partial [Cladochytrium replicatum]